MVNKNWLVVDRPLWKICSSVGMMTFPTDMESHKIPWFLSNHQPENQWKMIKSKMQRSFVPSPNLSVYPERSLPSQINHGMKKESTRIFRWKTGSHQTTTKLKYPKRCPPIIPHKNIIKDGLIVSSQKKGTMPHSLWPKTCVRELDPSFVASLERWVPRWRNHPGRQDPFLTKDQLTHTVSAKQTKNQKMIDKTWLNVWKWMWYLSVHWEKTSATIYGEKNYK